MVVRHSLRFLFAACLTVVGGVSARGGAPLATHPALTFFSSITEEPLARLEAEAIAPRYVSHGPFQVPAPGVSVVSPSLTFHDQPCTADDWAGLLKGLGAWQGLPKAVDFVLTLPDGRSFVFARPPTMDHGTLSGLVRPLTAHDAQRAKPDLWMVRIGHDNKSALRIDLGPLPPRPTYSAVPGQTEPAAPSPSPSETAVPSAANEPSTP